jgi:aldehyde:ferredoxin oxidoreductase
VHPLDPENILVFVTGPLGGVPVIGGSRWQACAKSPAVHPASFCYGNFGGTWGAELKFAGYDAVVVKGKATSPVFMYLCGTEVSLREASHLWGMGAVRTRHALKDELGHSVRIAAIGPAGENMAVMANLVADDDATGAIGLGAVMGSKMLKAIAVRRTAKQLNIAAPGKLAELTRYYRSLDRKLEGVLGDIDFKVTGPNVNKAPCYGCLGNCLRVTYEAGNGARGKYMCGGPFLYKTYADRYNSSGSDDVAFHALRLCDDYGLDLMAIGPALFWLQRCYTAGLLDDHNTGIPLSKLGSLETVDTLMRKISFREGFGDTLARGLTKAAAEVGRGTGSLLPTFLFQGDQIELYSPRLYNTNALLYATEPRMPIQQLHEVSQVVGKWLSWHQGRENAYLSYKVLRDIARRFWGSEAAADFSTWKGKALAAKKIQDRQYAKECLGLCDFMWPILDIEHSVDHVGDPTLESKIASAVTGRQLDENHLNAIGEKVFNLQRAILVQEGRMGKKYDTLPDHSFTVPLKLDMTNPDCLVPAAGDSANSLKGAVVDREAFETAMEEYYSLRGWDPDSGLQTARGLKALGLADIVGELKLSGCLADDTLVRPQRRP